MIESWINSIDISAKQIITFDVIKGLHVSWQLCVCGPKQNSKSNLIKVLNKQKRNITLKNARFSIFMLTFPIGSVSTKRENEKKNI